MMLFLADPSPAAPPPDCFAVTSSNADCHRDAFLLRDCWMGMLDLSSESAFRVTLSENPAAQTGSALQVILACDAYPRAAPVSPCPALRTVDSVLRIQEDLAADDPAGLVRHGCRSRWSAAPPLLGRAALAHRRPESSRASPRPLVIRPAPDARKRG